MIGIMKIADPPKVTPNYIDVSIEYISRWPMGLENQRYVHVKGKESVHVCLNIIIY